MTTLLWRLPVTSKEGAVATGKLYTRKEIVGAVSRWLDLLGLTAHWQVRVHIQKKSVPRGAPRACAWVDWDYKEADLYFAPDKIRRLQDNLDEITLHEVWHIFDFRAHDHLQRRARNGADRDKLEKFEENDTTFKSRCVLHLWRKAKGLR